MAVKHAMVIFVAAATLCYLILLHSEAQAAASSSIARPSALRSSPHFDSFVLFGQIDPYNLKEITRHKLRLSVELGNHVWLQDVESKYYTFQLPTRNYSGLVGRLSILACDEYATALWTHSFMVQNDVGAYRLDINAEETPAITIGQGHDFEGLCGSNNARVHRLDINAGGTVGTIISQQHLLEEASKQRSKQIPSRGNAERCHRYIEQEATCPLGVFSENYLTHSLQDTKHAGKLNLMQQHNTQVLEMIYPQQLLLYSTSLQKWHLALLATCFAMIQLLNALVHKSILLLEASLLYGIQIPVGEVATMTDTNPAAWQLCLSKPLQAERHFFDSKKSGDMHCMGNSSLEEAWHAAEQYLNEAIDNDCQGAYFSYNCTSPQAQQERHESALGKWNRDNAGRLIRQLWS